VEELFNSVLKENTGRAVHDQPPITYEQIRNKWKRVLENTAANVEVDTSNSRGNTSQPSHNNNGGNRGRGGTIVRGRGAARGGQRGGFRSGPTQPQATLQGIRACFGFNSAQGCSRPMRDATTCGDTGLNSNVYIHCCNFWDVNTKRHCLSTAHNKLTGNH
jgi:hypothetical protein